MSFFNKLSKIFKKSPGEAKPVHPSTPSQEDIRKNAIRRKLKDIGYRTEEIRVIYNKGKGENRKNGPKTRDRE
jgi:hypothetical protein